MREMKANKPFKSTSPDSTLATARGEDAAREAATPLAVGGQPALHDGGASGETECTGRKLAGNLSGSEGCRTMAEQLLTLQRQYGNRYVQRILTSATCRPENTDEVTLQTRYSSAQVTTAVRDDSLRDFAVPPTTPGRRVRTLTEPQIQEAITYNQARHGDANEIGTLRDILGLSRIPEVIDRDFVLALVEYQAQYGLPQDGKLGRKTAERLAREIVAEAGYLGPGNEGSLAGEFQLKTDIDALITANNRTYADYKRTILAGTMIQGQVALQDRAFLRRLQGQLSWDNFAKCIELLGRTAPSGADMIADSQVRAALIVAWNASSPAVTIWPTHDPAFPGHACNPPPGPPPPAPAAHEEGGFIYLDLITGDLATRAVAPGGQAVLPLNNPPLVANSIVVGGYHTHPNVGACWGAPFFSGPDQNWVAANGVPLLMRGAFPGVANTSDHAHGSPRRHLAGNRGLPGPTGGLAPQSSLDGKTDDL